MLAVTRTDAHFQGMQLRGLGWETAPELHKILGVPFWWQRASIYGKPYYYLVNHKDYFNVFYVPKNKTPKALAVAIDQVLAKASAEILKKTPTLASNPKELLKQAKFRTRMTSLSSRPPTAIPLPDAKIGSVEKVNGVSTEHRYVLVREEGDRWRIHLKDQPSGSSIPGVDLVYNVIDGVTKAIGSTVNEVVDVVEDGFQWALEQIEKLACAAAKSDLVKGAVNAYATGYGGPAAGMATDAAINKARSTICSTGSPAKPPPPPPKVEVVPWYKRPSTYVAGVGALAVGTIGVLAVRKVRR